MCARYTLRISRLANVAAAVGAEFTAEDEELYKPRYNVALRDLAWVLVSIADRRVLRRARWNYLNAAKRPLTNIRSCADNMTPENRANNRRVEIIIGSS